MNDIESMFAELAQNRGWTAYRSGWPDFLLIRGGKPCFVEVKSLEDQLMPSQARMFQALERTGVSVFVWWANMPDRLIPWRRFRRLRREYKPTPAPEPNALGLSQRGVEAVRSVLRRRAQR
jgi:hypothetical protein